MKRALKTLLIVALVAVPLACTSDDDHDPLDDHPQRLRAQERERDHDNRSEYRQRD